jgi:hypothetical protein
MSGSIVEQCSRQTYQSDMLHDTSCKEAIVHAHLLRESQMQVAQCWKRSQHWQLVASQNLRAAEFTSEATRGQGPNVVYGVATHSVHCPVTRFATFAGLQHAGQLDTCSQSETFKACRVGDSMPSSTRPKDSRRPAASS